MAAIMTERKNLLKLLLYRPFEVLKIAPFFLKFFVLYIIKKIAVLFGKIYKKIIINILLIQSNFEMGKNSKEKKTEIFHFNIFPDLKLKIEPFNNKMKIKLADSSVGLKKKINWGHHYKDIENTFSINRFGWLLSLLLENHSRELAEKSILWIKDWIKTQSKNISFPVWESYSVSERLSNWPFILLIVNNIINIPEIILKEIKKNMIFQIKYLLLNIENRGKYTNNHILNNARGLYISGIILNYPPAVIKGKQLFIKWTEKLFDSDGMLTEHSSHYQFLLCQRFEQIYLLSCRLNDSSFNKFIKKWYRLMSKACEFFIVNNSEKKINIPMIGDISPDFNFSWLITDTDKGWPQLKKWMACGKTMKQNIKQNIIMKSGEFVRVNIKDIVIFWHIKSDESALLNHGHYDIGSFTMFYKGREIFSDPGCFSYTNDGLINKSARAHSTITIDSLGSSCEDSKLNSLNIYHYQKNSYDISKENNTVIFKINAFGFNRLAPKVKWVRCFIIEKNKMYIEDNIQSTGGKILETRFQFSPGIKIIKENDYINIIPDFFMPIKLYVPKFNINIRKSLECSKEYGKKASGISVICRKFFKDNITKRYEIRWQ